MKKFSLKQTLKVGILAVASLAALKVQAQEAQPAPKIDEQARFEECLAKENERRERRERFEARAREAGRTEEEIRMEAADQGFEDEQPSKCVPPAPVEKKGQELEPAPAAGNAADAEMGSGGCSMNTGAASTSPSTLFSALWGAGAIVLVLRQRKKAS